MCKSPLHPFLHALPKCEHHIHVEGALTPSLVFSFAAKNHVQLPDQPIYRNPDALAARYRHFEDLHDFLKILKENLAVLVTEDDFHQLAWSYLVTAHSDGVRHVELSFDPQSHTSRGVDIGSVVEGISTACRRAERELDMSTRLIMCFLRDWPVSSAEDTLRSAHRFVQDGVVHGVGLDSSEVGFPPEPFEGVFRAAKESGLHRTAHAGEEGGVPYLKGTLASLGVERIDHGIRLAEDPGLLREISRKKILLTICPLSNMRLQQVESVGSLPLRNFLGAGVQFSLNSDDPAYFGGSVLGNYCAVQQAFDFNLDDWKRIAVAGIEGSWVSKERKEDILRQVNEVMAQFIQSNCTSTC
ncbi:hypothetical protein VTO42DRAFT_4128 [Malbranchea cinnamomea]